MQVKSTSSELRRLCGICDWKEKEELNLLIAIYLLQSLMKANSNFCKILHSWKEGIWREQEGSI